MKKIILSIIIITCVATIVSTGDKIPEENQTILKSHNKEYGPKGQWVPAKTQTSKALEAVYKFLDKKMAQEWREKQRLVIKGQISSYYVQFLGIKIEGRKVIHCNFFRDEDLFKRKKDSYVFVLDGGASFWRINYDIEKDKCLDFEVNGEA